RRKPANPTTSRRGARKLDAYARHLEQARAELGITEQPPASETTDAPWREYYIELNEACVDMYTQGTGFFSPHSLGFSADDMAKDGDQLEALSSAEEMLVAELGDVRAAKDVVKRRVIVRTGKLMTSVRCRQDDPQTSPGDRKALQKIAARPAAIVE